MSKYRRRLPQLCGRPFLTDGGLETTLIFQDGIDLPFFASFDLLKTERGATVVRDYYERYIAIAKRNRTGFVLEGATWRASPSHPRCWLDEHVSHTAARRAVAAHVPQPAPLRT